MKRSVVQMAIGKVLNLAAVMIGIQLATASGRAEAISEMRSAAPQGRSVAVPASSVAGGVQAPSPAAGVRAPSPAAGVQSPSPAAGVQTPSTTVRVPNAAPARIQPAPAAATQASPAAGVQAPPLAAGTEESEAAPDGEQPASVPDLDGTFPVADAVPTPAALAEQPPSATDAAPPLAPMPPLVPPFAAQAPLADPQGNSIEQ
jgi:hypothetical protein